MMGENAHTHTHTHTHRQTLTHTHTHTHTHTDIETHTHGMREIFAGLLCTVVRTSLIRISDPTYTYTQPKTHR